MRRLILSFLAIAIGAGFAFAQGKVPSIDDLLNLFGGRTQPVMAHLIESGKLCDDIGLPQLNPETDRAMICGSPGMLKDISALLNLGGFVISPHTGTAGDYVIERAFVER